MSLDKIMKVKLEEFLGQYKLDSKFYATLLVISSGLGIVSSLPFGLMQDHDSLAISVLILTTTVVFIVGVISGRIEFRKAKQLHELTDIEFPKILKMHLEGYSNSEIVEVVFAGKRQGYLWLGHVIRESRAYASDLEARNTLEYLLNKQVASASI